MNRRNRALAARSSSPRRPEPPDWLAYVCVLLGFATTAAIFEKWPPPRYLEIGIPVLLATSLAWYQIFRLFLRRRYEWESLPRMLLLRDRWRRPAQAPEWWDFTPEQVDAMSLDDLRRAYERALDELEPVGFHVQRRRSSQAAQTPPSWQDRLSPDQHAKAVRQRYERLRDAYYARRDA